MDRRTARLLNGLLALCCLTLVFAAVSPFATIDPHSKNPVDERFTVPESDEYRATGAVVADSETALEFEGAVTAGGGRYLSLGEGTVRTEQYQASPGDPVYRRIIVEDDSRTDRRRAQIQSEPGWELLRENQTDGAAEFIVKQDSNDLAGDVSGAASVVVMSLYLVGYEQEADTAQAATVYKPKNGWYEGRKAYHVTGTTGTVRTVGDTTAVRSARVTLNLTRPAGTYAELALVRLTGDAPKTYHLSFEFESGETTVRRPAWVTEVRTDSDDR
ncbi:hypothetical protein SAMN05443574_11631 [Haloarcula vallismortis]|uniref:Uncharacterized protein n=2 Tax=Haloarcula vallismortis TaxID=28442 RepID=M0J677_HALVA|nr:hypothetical protein [Haloarcula vallismortis]EMA04627.1 hypothetical protein C437_13810 [Haloarcula vallismortis ATCC 29715]SDX15737.1 hypothetical protein SAMN05443574_11631 [Haloarcula vallismortis]